MSDDFIFSSSKAASSILNLSSSNSNASRTRKLGPRPTFSLPPVNDFSGPLQGSRNVQSSSSNAAAVSGRLLSGILPSLHTFLSANAASSALARDLNALSDNSLLLRKDSLSRLCLCLCGVDWVSKDGVVSLANGDTEDGIPEQERGTLLGLLSATSHKSRQQSKTLALVASLSQATAGASDPAYSNYQHEISEVAALLTGKGDGGLWGGGRSDPAGEALRGGACELVELSGLTRAVAACLEGSYSTYLEDAVFSRTAMGGSILGSGCVGDSDDEDGVAGPESSSDALNHNPPPPGAAAASTSAATLQNAHRALLCELWLPHLMKPILQRWTDPCEAVRMGAIRITATCISALHDLTPTLPFLIPALVERINGVTGWTYDADQKMFAKGARAAAAHKLGRVLPGCSTTTQGILAEEERDHYVTRVSEPSEEVRAACVCVIHALLHTTGRGGFRVGEGHHPLESYALELVLCIHALAVDTAPNLRVLAVPVLIQIINLLPGVLKHFAPAFIRSVMVGGLDHRHAKVRLGTLDAIDALVHCPDEAKQRGAGSEALMWLLGGRGEANVIPIAAFYGRDVSHNYAAKLALEGNAAVRERWVAALGGWCTRLPDRYDWWPFLTPYLLSEVAGGGGEGAEALLPTSKQALAFLDGLGAALEKEKVSEWLDRLQYGMDAAGKWEGAPLPAPFSLLPTPRPRLGARMFVRAHSRRLLAPLLAELRTWSPFGTVDGSGMGTRGRAAALLASLLVFYEEAIAGEAASVLSTCVACVDLGVETGTGGGVGASSALAVAPSIRACARLLGRHLPPHATLSFLSGLLDKDTGLAMLSGGGGGGSRLQASSILAVLSLILGEWCSCPSKVLPHSSFPALLELIEAARKEIFPSLLRGGEGASSNRFNSLQRASAAWRAAGEGRLEGYHASILPVGSFVVSSSRGASAAAAPQTTSTTPIIESPPQTQPSSSCYLSPSISFALQKVREASAKDLLVASAKMTHSVVGPSSSSSSPSRAEYTSTSRARILACALQVARLTPYEPEPLTASLNTLLPLLLVLRGELAAEGGEDPSSLGSFAPCPHWGLSGHPTPPHPHVQSILSPSQVSTPFAYQGALIKLLSLYPPLSHGDIYSLCPWSGGLTLERPLPLGFLCDLALVSLALAAVDPSGKSQKEGKAEVEEGGGLENKLTLFNAPPFPAPLPLPPIVLTLITRRWFSSSLNPAPFSDDDGGNHGGSRCVGGGGLEFFLANSPPSQHLPLFVSLSAAALQTACWMGQGGGGGETVKEKRVAPPGEGGAEVAKVLQGGGLGRLILCSPLLLLTPPPPWADGAHADDLTTTCVTTTRAMYHAHVLIPLIAAFSMELVESRGLAHPPTLAALERIADAGMECALRVEKESPCKELSALWTARFITRAFGAISAEHRKNTKKFMVASGSPHSCGSLSEEVQACVLRLFRSLLSLWEHLSSCGVIAVDDRGMNHEGVGGGGEDDATLEGGENEDLVDFFTPSLAKELEGVIMQLASMDVQRCSLALEHLWGGSKGATTLGLASRLEEHLSLLLKFQGLKSKKETSHSFSG